MGEQDYLPTQWKGALVKVMAPSLLDLRYLIFFDIDPVILLLYLVRKCLTPSLPRDSS